MTIRTRKLAPEAEGLEQAAQIILAGGLVSFPTETVYGLGADALNSSAVQKVFAVKGRPSNNPLIIHAHSYSMITKLVHVCPEAKRLAKRYWPGSLTLILPKIHSAPIPSNVSAGTDHLAVRIPSYAPTLELIERCGRPLVGPSANRSGKVTATTPQHVLDDFDGTIDAVLDGGQCEKGLESTIVAFEEGQFRLLRPGAITTESIYLETGVKIDFESSTTQILSPGTLSRHYSTDSPIRLDVNSVQPGEAFIGFGNTPEPSDFNLSATGNLEEAAMNLFTILREADQWVKDRNLDRIAVAPIPSIGLGITINDRLNRAAMRA